MLLHVFLPGLAPLMQPTDCITEDMYPAGPSDALLTAANLTAGQNFDSGAVCANTQTAYVYVKNDCPLPSRATIRVLYAPSLSSTLPHVHADGCAATCMPPDGWGVMSEPARSI